MIDQVDAVVLAGNGGLAGFPHKALIPLGGRVMVDYVVTALRNCSEVRKIVLVGSSEELKKIYSGEGAAQLLFAEGGASLLDSFRSGLRVLEEVGEFQWVLACTGDIPFLTVGALSDFLARCRAVEADFYYPVIPREKAEEKFPGVKRTYARLQEGTFTGGNIFLIKRSALEHCLPIAQEVVSLRKKPVALARFVGIDVFWKYLLGRLKISDVEKRALELVGCRGRAVITPYPEIGVDIDKESDLELARRLFSGDWRKEA
jgi:molybdopterin-guanine dinucleotide biosynthesis protein A